MTVNEILEQDVRAMYHATAGLFRMVHDDALDWKPQSGQNWMNVGQLLKHCTEACGTTVKGFVTGDWGFPTGEDASEADAAAMMRAAEQLPAVSSVEEARRLLDEDQALTLGLLSGLTEERLLNEMSSPPWGGPPATLFQHINSMIWHLGQHKGQLYYYLKLQGRDVNTMHLWAGGTT